MRIVVAVLLCAGLLAGCTDNPIEALTDDGPVPVRAEDGGVLEVGGSLEAELTVTSPRRSYRVDLGEGQRAAVDMVAVDDDLDTFLRIYDDAGDLVTEDDDGGDGLNSRATLRTTAPATFIVEAASYRDSDSGRYRLTVLSQEVVRPDPTRVLLNETGEVTPQSAERSRFAFQGSSGDSVIVSIEALADGLDPVVELLGPGGVVLGRDDDGGEGRNSLLQVRLQETGTHVVVVTAFDPEQTGEFQVLVTTARRSGSLTGARPSDDEVLAPRPLTSSSPITPGAAATEGE